MATLIDNTTTVDAFEELFVSRLATNLERAPKPLVALDFSCGTGFTTLKLFPTLPPGTRVIAVGDDRDSLNTFHGRLKDLPHGSVFARKESGTRLPFGEGVFDLAYASYATQTLPEEPRLLLRQVFRSLRAPGKILLAVPLRETVVELMSAVAPWMGGHDTSDVRTFVDEDTALLSASEWRSEFERLGATDVGIDSACLDFQVHQPVDTHAPFIQHVLPLWISSANPTHRQLVARLNAESDRPIEVQVHIACIHGRKTAA